jgi:hypothetical protein
MSLIRKTLSSGECAKWTIPFHVFDSSFKDGKGIACLRNPFCGRDGVGQEQD